MGSGSTATGWVLAILVSSMRSLLGVGLMIASALARSGPLHGKQDHMLKINLPMPTPGAVRRGSVHTERPNGPPAPGRPRRVGEPNRGPGLSRGVEGPEAKSA